MQKSTLDTRICCPLFQLLQQTAGQALTSVLLVYIQIVKESLAGLLVYASGCSSHRLALMVCYGSLLLVFIQTLQYALHSSALPLYRSNGWHITLQALYQLGYGFPFLLWQLRYQHRLLDRVLCFLLLPAGVLDSCTLCVCFSGILVDLACAAPLIPGGAIRELYFMYWHYWSPQTLLSCIYLRILRI